MLGTATKLQTVRNIKLQGAVNGNANFDGSGNVTITTTQGNIAVITGSMTLEANSQQNFESGVKKQTLKDIDFPEGFNKDNCVCIAFGIKRFTEKNYNYGTGDSASYNATTGAYDRNIVLGSSTDNSKINLSIWQLMTSSTTIYYKIVLLKI